MYAMLAQFELTWKRVVMEGQSSHFLREEVGMMLVSSSLPWFLFTEKIHTSLSKLVLNLRMKVSSVRYHPTHSQYLVKLYKWQNVNQEKATAKIGKYWDLDFKTWFLDHPSATGSIKNVGRENECIFILSGNRTFDFEAMITCNLWSKYKKMS